MSWETQHRAAVAPTGDGYDSHCLQRHILWTCDRFSFVWNGPTVHVTDSHLYGMVMWPILICMEWSYTCRQVGLMRWWRTTTPLKKPLSHATHHIVDSCCCCRRSQKGGAKQWHCIRGFSEFRQLACIMPDHEVMVYMYTNMWPILICMEWSCDRFSFVWNGSFACFYVMGDTAQSRSSPTGGGYDSHCLQRHVFNNSQKLQKTSNYLKICEGPINRS